MTAVMLHIPSRLDLKNGRRLHFLGCILVPHHGSQAYFGRVRSLIRVRCKLNWTIFARKRIKMYASKISLTPNETYNGSQLKNPDISGAIFTPSLSILILSSQCVEGAKYVRLL